MAQQSIPAATVIVRLRPISRQSTIRLPGCESRRSLGNSHRLTAWSFADPRRRRRAPTAVAEMAHLGVANVLDAGTTAYGQPCFLMEFDKGDSITKDCDRNGLTLVGRLHLFVQVCRAVPRPLLQQALAARKDAATGDSPLPAQLNAYACLLLSCSIELLRNRVEARQNSQAAVAATNNSEPRY